MSKKCEKINEEINKIIEKDECITLMELDKIFESVGNCYALQGEITEHELKSGEIFYTNKTTQEVNYRVTFREYGGDITNPIFDKSLTIIEYAMVCSEN